MKSINVSDKEAWKDIRGKHITSTDVAALFNASPYVTYYELWQRKRNGVVTQESSGERLEWGLHLEEPIAIKAAQDLNLGTPVKLDQYMYDPELRIGSSFDYKLGNGHLLEIKNVDTFAYADMWTADKAPDHIELQVQHQMLITGAKKCHIAALVGGNRLVHIERDANEEVHQEIMRRVERFWESSEPVPEADDARFIINQMNNATEGKELYSQSGDVVDVLVRQYLEINRRVKEQQKELEFVKAKLLLLMDDTERAKGDGWTISAGMVAPAQVSYERKSYRNFRITEKKGE